MLLKDIVTPYVFIAQDIIQFDTNINLERMVCMISDLILYGGLFYCMKTFDPVLMAHTPPKLI